jgi:uncharacterized protein
MPGSGKLKSLNLFSMYKTCILFCLLSISLSLFAQEKKQPVEYNAALAKKLGADDHGMKRYVLAYLKKGPNRSQDSATAAQLQSAHLANIQRMADAGDLVLAGPFLDDTEVRGIYIFNVDDIEKARKLTETDPAIQAGRLIMDLHPWYGSAALMEVNNLHKKIQKGEF